MKNEPHLPQPAPETSAACEQLNRFTIQTGAPFPFKAIDVDDLTKPIAEERTIAVQGKQYRVDGGVDDPTPRALRQIAEGFGLTEFQPKEETDDSTT